MYHCSQLIAIGAVLCAGGCIDFGYDIEPPELILDAPADAAEPADAGSDDGGGCVEGQVEPSDAGIQIAIITLNVDQPVVAVAPGETITWTNVDSEIHTVTAGAPGAELPVEQGGFDSGEFGTGERWAYRFCTVRTVVYFCATHPQQMNGYRIIVQESP